MRIACSMGIMAHNEEANIGRCLEAIVSQRTTVAQLTEIVVIASGCTDRTVEIVHGWTRRDPRVRLVVQAKREGKASAVNLFLAKVREKVLLLCSADLVPQPDAVEQVILPFLDPEVAMTTSRPVPVDDPKRFMGFAAHLLWELHHRINLTDFKAGEMIAFRKIFERIPYSSAVDEASIESVIRGQGYGVRYVPTAITWNKGPETLRDFLNQRRRIYAGHLAIRDGVGYRVATLNGFKILGVLLRDLDFRPKPFVWTWSVAALEAYGRFLGLLDYKKRRDHRVWTMATTTKALAPAAPAPAPRKAVVPRTRRIPVPANRSSASASTAAHRAAP